MINLMLPRVVGITIGCLWFCRCEAGSLAEPAATVITIDRGSSGRTFDGFGGLSAGASSRLLYDYPEPERSQILDYLFKPNYGAALQILKVEIGGDSDSTCGSEASHERERGEVNGARGYEWWLMKEAKKRNPNIKLWGLEWAAPGWFKGGFWSPDNVTYQLDWLRLAKEQGLQIDYMGGWNESGANAAWYAAWHKALAEHDPHIKIVAADDSSRKWPSTQMMTTNAEMRDATDIIGQHDPDGARSGYEHCPVPIFARQLHKTIWDSELSSQGHDVGAIPLARALNRQYIEGRLTANVVWSPISAWYADLPLADTGLMLADRPWSGYYEIGKSIWVYAHTTQFTRIGWHYIDSACGYLSKGTSYVTLESPDGLDFTTVIETMDAPTSQLVYFKVTGSKMDSKPVQFWSTDLSSDNRNDYFVHARTIEASAGSFAVTLQPRHVYTLSTTTGQDKGDARPKAGPAEQLPLPYQGNFESYGGPGKLARYFSDLEGGFETATCGGGRTGLCYRQAVSTQPITWGRRDRMPPTTVMGDPRWWGDYRISVDALLEQDGYVELLGRVSCSRDTSVAGYHLRFSSTGKWRLYSEEIRRKDTVVAAGRAEFQVGKWHSMALSFSGTKIQVSLDNRCLATLHDAAQTSGQMGLRVSPMQNAEFDNLKVAPTASWPTFVPHDKMKAQASSEHMGNYLGYTFEASHVIDERPETCWSAEWSPPIDLPQEITVDLGGEQRLCGLACQPSLDDFKMGYITRYRIFLSEDGKKFASVADGSWPATSSVKLASWPAEGARYVRLEAVKTSGGEPKIGELNFTTTPFN
jgi:Glycosyl hydrolase family 59/F5/8 type C domain/Glycosyl hydrolase family 59 central domain